MKAITIETQPILKTLPLKSWTHILSIFLLMLVIMGCTITDQKAAKTSSKIVHADKFQAALDRGMSAAISAQSAQTKNDWNLVASRWQQGIELLNEVPDSNANFATAQKKITEYQKNLAIAQQKAQNASNNSSQTAQQSNQNLSNSEKNLVASNSPWVFAFCQFVNPTDKTQVLELNKLQFYRPIRDDFDFENEGDYIIGCLTNHSNQPIENVGASYEYAGSAGFGFGGDSLTFPVDEIKPGQTVPFRSSFSIDRNVPDIQLSSLSSEAGEVSLSITVSR